MWRQGNDFIRSTVRHGTYIQPGHDERRQAMSAPSLRPSAVARNALAVSSLPTVNSSRHNRRFSSPAHGQSRLCTSRRALFIGTATIVLLLFLGLHAHSSGSLPVSGISRDETLVGMPIQPIADGQGKPSRLLSVPAATRIQNELNAKTNMHRRPTCSWTTWHDQRYAPLRNTSKRIVLAMNLHQNRELMSTIAQELPVVLEWIGVKNFFVTIYEDGSSDGTQEYLGDCEYTCFKAVV